MERRGPKHFASGVLTAHAGGREHTNHPGDGPALTAVALASLPDAARQHRTYPIKARAPLLAAHQLARLPPRVSSSDPRCRNPQLGSGVPLAAALPYSRPVGTWHPRSRLVATGRRRQAPPAPTGVWPTSRVTERAHWTCSLALCLHGIRGNTGTETPQAAIGVSALTPATRRAAAAHHGMCAPRPPRCGAGPAR